MDTNVIPGNLLVQGTLTATAFNPPAGSVTKAAIPAAAGIEASKVQHAHRRVLAQASATTVSALTQVVHVVIGTGGTVQAVKAGAVVPAVGTDTATVDVKRNGTTILSGTISLTSSQSARQLVSGTITLPTLIAGDVLEVIITPVHSTGTLAQGVFVAVDIFEDPQ